ncbi:MAG: HEAT repeat domain-containing protein, partial [Propionibacteriaceae bacterium]|nr:HEAT repeat domain-containing protein [Propionibacteriaceae bacterium]
MLRAFLSLFGGQRASVSFRQALPDDRALADLLDAFVNEGRRSAELMNLQPAALRMVTPWINWRLGLTAEQWVRLGEVFAMCPQCRLRDWPADVPKWFRALQYARGRSEHIAAITAWDPAWFGPVLRQAVRPDAQALAVLRSFFCNLQDSYYGVAYWKVLENGPQTLPFKAYVREHLHTVPQALADAPVAVRLLALDWLSTIPDALPRLLPMLIEYACAATSKQVREDALARIAALPVDLATAGLAAVISQATPANVGPAINQAARMGDPGRTVLEAALAEGRGAKVDEMLREALGRSMVAATAVTEQELVIPPMPPLEVPQLGEEFVAAAQAAAADWGNQMALRAQENSRARSYYLKQAKWAQSLTYSDFAGLRDYLNGRGKRSKLLDTLPLTMFTSLPGVNLLAKMRLCLQLSSERNFRLNVYTLRQVLGVEYDYRLLAAALADVPRGLDMVAGLPFAQWDWDCRDSGDLVWPFFAEHPERIDKELGLPGYETSSHWGMGKALQILSLFPAIPGKYIPILAELATGETKTYRRMAQRVLEKQPGAVHFALNTLVSTKQEVRAQAATWAGRLSDPTAIGPLREALAKEKREVARAAMLSALRTLGDDISHHLSPQALAAEAKKGLAGKAPASMVWFPLDALPACRWADNTPVDPDIIRWWA